MIKIKYQQILLLVDFIVNIFNIKMFVYYGNANRLMLVHVIRFIRKVDINDKIKDIETKISEYVQAKRLYFIFFSFFVLGIYFTNFA